MDADNAVQQANYRQSLFANYDFEVNDNLSLFAQGIYGFAGVKGPWFNSIVMTGPWQATIFKENPFLPQNVRDIMTTEGRDRFNMGYSGLAPLDRDTPLGSYSVEQNDEMYSGMAGFDYDFTGGAMDGWNLNAYAQYSENGQEMIFRDGMIMGRLPLALDVIPHPTNGSPVCRAAVFNPGTFGDCVPVNIFGGVESVSPQAASYLQDEKTVVASDSEQIFAEAVLNGEVYQGFGAGPIMMALGASYRKDELRQWKKDLQDEFVFLNGVNTGFRGLIPENLPNGMPGVRAGSVPPGFTGNSSLSNVLFTGSYQTPDTVLTGGFSVKEVFGEIDVPLLADRTLINSLDLNLAYRYAEYTGSGGIDSWKYGLNWRLTDEFRIRATRSRDVRAANIRERFDATAGGANVNDPVFGNAVIGTSSRTGGNPLVEPEKADTTTIGLVWQPTGMLDGMAISFDWFNIDIKDALGQLTFQNIVDGCHIQGAADLCQYILRDPTTNQITRIDRLFINLSQQVLTGIDAELNYRREISLFGGDESLGFRLYASQVREYYNQLPGAPRDNIGLEQPEWRVLPALTYSRGPLRVFLQGRYFDSRTLNRNWVEGVNVDVNSVASVTYADLNLSYEMEMGNQTYRLFANATNLFDRAPPQTPGNPGFVGGTGGPSTGLYDTVGRTYTVGANVSF